MDAPKEKGSPEGPPMQLGWYAFQIAVISGTVYWIGTWADLKEYGAAPWVVGAFVAFVATGLLARLIDRLRFPPRRFESAEHTDSGVLSLRRAWRHLRNGAQSVRRIGVRKDFR